MAPKNNHKLIQQALKLHTAGNLHQAKDIYLQALITEPDNFDALHLSGAIALQTGDLAGAEQWINKALSQGRLSGPRDKHRKRLGDAHNNLALALQKLKRLDEALAAARQALRYRPEDADVKANLGLILKALGLHEEAELHLRQAIGANPKQVKALIGLSLILYLSERRDEAEQHIAVALELEPRNPAVHNVRAALFTARGDVEGAVRAFNTALLADPTNHDAWFNQAQLYLGMGRFADGWPGFYLHHPARRDATVHHEPFPPRLDGQRIGVIRNQGIGDELFYLRFVPLLKERGAEVLYRTEPRMMSFAQRLEFIDRVISTGPQGRIAVDQALLIDYLPYLLQLGDQDILPSISLLAKADSLQRMALRLDQAGPPPYLGVTWRAGRMRSEVDFRKEMTEILFKEIPPEQLAAALRHWPGTVLILQRNPVADEIARFQQALGRSAVDCSDVNDELEDMLALLSLTERYVTVSNTNLHLRAAAGLPSHVLVPWPPEWRWGLREGRSQWFPDCPVYRQASNGDWQVALAQLGRELLL